MNSRNLRRRTGLPIGGAIRGSWHSVAALLGCFLGHRALRPGETSLPRFAGMAAQKIHGVRRFAAAMREVLPAQKHLVLIFIGDNGQGDASAARALLETGAVQRAYIHVVSDEEEAFCGTHVPGLVLFCSYQTVLRDLAKFLDVATWPCHCKRWEQRGCSVAARRCPTSIDAIAQQNEAVVETISERGDPHENS